MRRDDVRTAFLAATGALVIADMIWGAMFVMGIGIAFEMFNLPPRSQA